jgi:hypothetical protein
MWLRLGAPRKARKWLGLDETRPISRALVALEIAWSTPASYKLCVSRSKPLRRKAGPRSTGSSVRSIGGPRCPVDRRGAPDVRLARPADGHAAGPR